MNSLAGMRVALLEARRAEELATLVRRFGGEPYCVAAVREQPRSSSGEDVLALLKHLEEENFCVIVFSTGVGVRALFNEARTLGRQEELRQALRNATIVCRGPKPVAALKREGLDSCLRAREPYTTPEVLGALALLPLRKQFVVVLHYGGRNLALVEGLLGRCAGLHELLLYDWELPEDTGPLHQLVKELVAGRVGAIAFTNQVQARHLFQIAEEAGLSSELRFALRVNTWVAAVGPSCAGGLESLGVVPEVVPEHPKVGAMIECLARHVSKQQLKWRGVA